MCCSYAYISPLFFNKRHIRAWCGIYILNYKKSFINLPNCTILNKHTNSYMAYLPITQFLNIHISTWLSQYILNTHAHHPIMPLYISIMHMHIITLTQHTPKPSPTIVHAYIHTHTHASIIQTINMSTITHTTTFQKKEGNKGEKTFHKMEKRGYRDPWKSTKTRHITDTTTSFHHRHFSTHLTFSIATQITLNHYI